MSEQVKTSGLAITSLVLGILSLVCGGPFLGIPAIICGLLALFRIKKGQATGTGLAIGGMVTGLVGILILSAVLAAIALPALLRPHSDLRKATCAGNLSQIGIACLMYSGDYSGYFPTNFEALNKQDYLIGGNYYACPGTNNKRSATPGTGDYLYFGSGLRDDNMNANTVVIITDKPENHDGKWINAYFIDGHVDGVNAASLEEAASKKGWIIPGVNREVSK